MDQGRMLNLLPFISVSLKIKKKKTNFRFCYSHGFLHESQSINLMSTVENLNSIVELSCVQWELMIDWVE